MRGRSVGVAVFQRVAGSIDTGALAVPEAEYAIDLALWIGLDLLRSQHRRRREVFVDRREKLNVSPLEEIFGAPKLHVDAAQRRTAIARNESGAIDPVGDVPIALIEQDAHQRLSAREEHASGLPRIAVLKRIIVQACMRRIGDF